MRDYAYILAVLAIVGIYMSNSSLESVMNRYMLLFPQRILLRSLVGAIWGGLVAQIWGGSNRAVIWVSVIAGVYLNIIGYWFMWRQRRP